MKAQLSKSGLQGLFILLIAVSGIKAQMNERIYIDSGFVDNKFMQSFGLLRPHVYKDGAYVFYTDSKKNTILFEGNILNGKATGTYYSYRKLSNDSVLSKTKTIVRVVDDKFNGICKLWEPMAEYPCHEYYFFFEAGILKELKFINPFIRSMPPEGDVPDTLKFTFKEGKFACLEFLFSKTGLNVQPEPKSCMDINGELERALRVEPYYDHKRTDSSLINYESQYNVLCKGTNLKGSIRFKFDTQKNLNQVLLNSWYEYRGSTFSTTPFWITFNKENDLDLMSCTIDFPPTVLYDDQNNERIAVINQDIMFNFYKNGLLVMEE